MQIHDAPAVFQTPVSSNMKKLLPSDKFSLVPGHIYRVSIQLKDWSPLAAAQAREALGYETLYPTLYDFAKMSIELKDPPPNINATLLAPDGVELTTANQTVTWEFRGPDRAAGTKSRCGSTMPPRRQAAGW